MLKSYQLICGH